MFGQKRSGADIVKSHEGADSAAIIFDAIQSAKAKGYDVLLCDTAGRLQNKDHLMKELEKIVRVIKKRSTRRASRSTFNYRCNNRTKWYSPSENI